MDVSLLQMFLIVAIAFIYDVDKYGVQVFSYMAVLTGTLAGVILGDPLTGMQIGATVQLMSLGVAPIGGSSAPDYPLAALIATYITITTGQDAGVGVAVGVAVGMVGVQLDVLVKIANGFIARKAQEFMVKGNYKMMTGIMWLGPIMFGLCGAVPAFIMLAFGVDAVNLILEVMPAWFTTGLTIAGGMLPVVGMAMLLTFMPTKKYLSFVIIGYVLSSYLGMSILPIALLGGAAAYESYKQIVSRGESNVGFSEEMLEDE